MNQKFWLIWNERGNVPTHKHLTFDEARAEAERLARGQPGHQFHLLSLEATCAYQQVQWVSADEFQPPF